MTKNKTLLIFFALVFRFCVFADSFSDCESIKLSVSNELVRISNSADSINRNAGLINNGYWDGQWGDSQFVQYVNSQAYNIVSSSQFINSRASSALSSLQYLDCSTNGSQICVDLYPVVSVLSNIVSILEVQRNSLLVLSENSDNIRLTVDEINNFLYFASYRSYSETYLNVRDNAAISAISNLVDNLNSNYNFLSNHLSRMQFELVNFNSSVSENLAEFLSIIWSLFDSVVSIDSSLVAVNDNLQSILLSLNTYLPYLQIMSNDLRAIVTNGTFQIDQNYTNQFYYSNLLGFDRFRYYAQGQLNNTQLSLYPLSPYDNMQNLRNATIYDAVAAGFESLLISQGSINNYLYWLKAVAGSNRLESVENHIFAVSNLVGRLDDYVLNDFSNEIVKISNNLSFLTNRVDYTTNLVHLAELVETNNSFLASIDSKLDVLDYIKILSTTPLSEYSGDQDYFDYLTNLYINGSSSSGQVSTNWFERIEILLASLVFGDSDGTNGVPQGVHMEGVDSSAVESALTDFSYSSDFTSGIDSLDQTKQNFFQILHAFHNSVQSVTCPASVSIGIGGLNGEDTRDFNDLMHGHFQVSFSVGSSDIFTTVVRSVTTICWVLVFLVIFWKAGFWLLRKMIYLYRVVNRLFWSVFTR